MALKIFLRIGVFCVFFCCCIFCDFSDTFEVRYLVNPAFYEKSMLTLINSKFCEESKNGIKKIRPTEKKVIDVFTFAFCHQFARHREKIHFIFCSEFPGYYDKIKPKVLGSLPECPAHFPH